MPRGRPKVKIDLEAVKELASEGNTQADIADALGFARSHFSTNKALKKAYWDGIAEMRLSLRHFQYNAARDGNIQMLIWLGRQFLGQKDQPEESAETEDTDAYFAEAGLNEE